MKKLIILSAIVTLSSGAVFAENVAVSGTVPSICEVKTANTSVLFTSLAKDQVSNVDFTVKCNDPDGATVSLTSSEGHMQTVDGQDGTGIGYKAELKASPYDFTLTALSGANDQVASQSQPGSSTLAAGISGKIKLTVLQDAIYSGNYTDQLMLSITAN